MQKIGVLKCPQFSEKDGFQLISKGELIHINNLLKNYRT